MDSKPTRGRPKGTTAKYQIQCTTFVNNGASQPPTIIETLAFKQVARAHNHLIKWLSFDYDMHVILRDTQGKIVASVYPKVINQFDLREWVRETLNSEAR